MKTLKIEPSLHNLLKRKALELDQTITVLANIWLADRLAQEGMINVAKGQATWHKEYQSPTNKHTTAGVVYDTMGNAYTSPTTFKPQ
jgi:hypothetical protein